MATQSRIPWPRSAWGFGGRSYPRGYSYGLLLPRRTLRTRAYVPDARDRMALGHGKLPYWHVMNFSLASQETQDGAIVPTDNFILLAMMGTSTPFTVGVDLPFRTQSFQLTDTSGNGVRFSTVGVDGENFVGTAQRPMIIKRPYPTPNMLSILNRTANRSTSANTVQLAFYGVKDVDAQGAAPPAYNA